MSTETRLLSGWGRTAPSAAELRRPETLEAVVGAFRDAGGRGVIARGLGRSYGDVAQNAGGLVVDLTGLRRILEFDRETGRLVVEAGCSLADILDLCLPAGWFLPVVPGTRHVTIGGALACDVHGKNHHRDGSFGRHVLAFTLLTPRGEIRELDPEHTPDEFAATVGGLGLTGIILEVTLRLLPVQTAEMRVTTERAANLDEALDRLAATDHLYRYSVAWVDCAAKGRGFGRSVLMRGDHATFDDLPAGRRVAPSPPRGRAIEVPAWASLAPLMRNTALAAFNELYFRRSRPAVAAPAPLESFFFPLDALGSWNRLYGRGGFLQYQFVVPFGAEETVREILRLVANGKRRPALVVLKRFGPAAGLLSFPRPGWTLALDIALPAPGLGTLLDAADDLVAAAGGCVYLAKDSRLRRDHFAEMYPELGRWREIQSRLDPQGRMQSDLARRLAVTRKDGTGAQ